MVSLQGDPLSPYQFIIVLEVLAISVRENDNIQGTMVDETEIKLELFADDLTAFLRNDESLRAFLEVDMKFGNCAGLTINLDKTEILILGSSVVAPIQDRITGNIEINESVKLLGIYVTYNRSLRHRNNRCH